MINLGTGLEDRGVIVTGAAGGIGRHVAATFAACGARVHLADLDLEAVNDARDRLDDPDRHSVSAVDLTTADGRDSLLQAAEDATGGVVALAHLAAVLIRRPTVDEVTEEDWDFQQQINLKTSFFLNRDMGAHLRRHRRPGAIVDFTSQGWWTGGYGGSVAYAATKGGIVSMVRGLARSFATEGIRVNAVSPGGVDTPMLRTGMSDEAMANFESLIPMGRLGQPSEMAGAVVFLCSTHASFITGATINVSGGQLMY